MRNKRRRHIVAGGCQAHVAEEKLDRYGAIYLEEFFLERPIEIKKRATIDGCKFKLSGNFPAFNVRTYEYLQITNSRIDRKKVFLG